MVLSFVLGIAYDLSIVAVKTAYSLGRYMIYGKEESENDKLTKIIKDTVQLQEEIRQLHAELVELKKSIEVKT